MSAAEQTASPLDRPIATTIFPTFTARRKHDTVTSFRDLAGRILKTTRPAKGQLPWLKLARFGDKRTPEKTGEDGTTTGGSLRNNANVLAISGVEGDYDGEKMGVDEAVALLRNAGISAMVYTSPSHSEDAPRWRVLCPLSTDRTPDTRERLLARLNGILGGVLSPESFTLSQSYYYGYVKKNPSHRAVLVDGNYLDDRDDLDADAIGKLVRAGKPERPVSCGGAAGGVSDKRWQGLLTTILNSLLSQAVDGQKHRQLWNHAVWLGGVYEQMGLTSSQAMDLLEACLPDTVEDWDAARKTAGEGLIAGRQKPITLEDREFRGRQRQAGNGHANGYANGHAGPSAAPGAASQQAEQEGKAPGEADSGADAPPAEEPQPDSAKKQGGGERKRPSNRSGSAAAFRKGKALRRNGATYDEMVKALEADPDTAEWARKKGRANDERELKRIWEKAEANGPVIKIEAGELHKQATETENALIASEIPIFQRGRFLMQPISLAMPASKGRVIQAACLGKLTVDAMIDRMCASAEYVRYDARSEDYVRTDPPYSIARILLSREGQWRFPVISGVITTPTMRPDGSILVEPGYDPVTRLFHISDPSLKLPPISHKPTKDDAYRDLQLLLQLAVEFPFVNGVAKAVAMSAMITPVVRAAMTVAPLHLLRAHTAGTGKSYLADIVSYILTGRECPVAQATDSKEEAEKSLGSLMLAGLPLISLDNCNGEIGSNLLAQAVERPLVQIRGFKTQDIIEVANASTFLATGNNATLRDDLVRRGITCDLDAGIERPELRQFKSNPLKLIQADRGRYVAACLTIVRAYLEAGKPGAPPRLASFEDWSDLVRGALIWLDCDDPLVSMEGARREDPGLLDLREMMAALNGQFGTNMITASRIASRTDERQQTDEYSSRAVFAHPEFRDVILRLFGERGEVNTRKVGNWMREKEGQVIDGHRIKRSDKMASGGGTQWFIEPVGS